MGQYEIIARQQFIIPPTPIQTFPSSYWNVYEDDGTAITTSSEEIGDSYYETCYLPGGGMNWNWRFAMDSSQLPDEVDYFIATASLTDIIGELVMQVTKFVALVPYPSWRVRIDLKKHPYTKFAVAPITTEGDITKVSFSKTLDWTGSLFGITPKVRHYWFCSLGGFGVPRLPHLWPFHDKLIPVGVRVEQFGASYP
jgi:hypothetical protein